MQSVSPYKTTLCKENAYWMARLAKEVYRKTSESEQMPDEEKILKNIREDDPDFLSVKGFDNNSAQAAVIEHKHYICLSFRGTNEVGDWLDNMDAFSVKKLFGEFHRGFFDSVTDVWTDILSYLQVTNSKPKRPLFVTGHSLGGAMATIAAAKLIHEDQPFTSVYTFGQPRALSRETARLFNIECKDRYYRFHNNNDIVTRVPIRFMGYSHVGTYLYITEEGEIHQDVGNWFRFVDYVDGALSSLKELKALDLVRDHSMDQYYNHIKNFDVR